MEREPVNKYPDLYLFLISCVSHWVNLTGSQRAQEPVIPVQGQPAAWDTEKGGKE